jgi:hypothetical protein
MVNSISSREGFALAYLRFILTYPALGLKLPLSISHLPAHIAYPAFSYTAVT